MNKFVEEDKKQDNKGEESAVSTPCSSEENEGVGELPRHTIKIPVMGKL